MRKESISASLYKEYINVYFFSEKQRLNKKQGGVISLWNCGGRTQLGLVNKYKQQQRLAKLVRQNWRFSTLFGGNCDFSYREYSVFVSCSQAEAKKISIAFKQQAFYYVNKGRVWLYNSKLTNQKTCLKPFKQHCSAVSYIPKTNAALRVFKTQIKPKQSPDK